MTLDQTLDQVDLDADPFDDDLAESLRTRAPSPRTTRATVVLGGLALVVAGFLGGVLVQRNVGTTPAASGLPTGNFPGRVLGATPGAGVGPSAAPGGAVTTGTVKLVDGTTVYLTTASGDVVTVKTDASTAVKLEQSGALTDLAVGATVSVQGSANADGVLTATQLTAAG